MRTLANLVYAALVAAAAVGVFLVVMWLMGPDKVVEEVDTSKGWPPYEVSRPIEKRQVTDQIKAKCVAGNAFYEVTN